MQRLFFTCLVLLLFSGLFGCQTPKTGTATSVPTEVLPRPSPTVPPTLEPGAADLAVRQMLVKETVCEKPCLFGIIPDQTTLQEAQAFYEHLNMGFHSTSQEGKRHYYEAGHGFADDWGLGVMNVVEGNLVRDMTVGISFVNYAGSNPNEEWLAYRPNAILERYGQPSAIEVFLSFPAEAGFPEGTAWYKIVMYFADADLIAQYDYQVTSADEKIIACPLTDEALGASFWLGKNPNNPPLRGVPLAEASAVSVEKFYDLLTKNPQSACLSLKPEAFVPKS